MNDATQPKAARATKLSAGLLVAALFAILAFAPLASAASNPVGSGSTTLVINNAFKRSIAKKGVKVLRINPTKLKGNRATFKVTGGSLDSASLKGTLNLAGGLKFKAGRKVATVRGLVLDTAKRSLTGRIGRAKVKLATAAGISLTAKEFGVSVKVSKLKLTGAAANKLNKALRLKGRKAAFKRNRVMAAARAEGQPSTLTIAPGNNLRLATAVPTITKLADAEVVINGLTPTAIVDPTTFDFPLSGGTVSPSANAGTVKSAGGLELVQDFGSGIKTEILLENFYYDLAAGTLGAVVVAHSTASKELDLGVLGESSVADVSLTGATVTADPTAHTVSVQNATATLQPVAAGVLDAFRKVAEGAFTKFLVEEFPLTPEEAAAMAAEKYAGDHINSGDPLGTLSFTANVE